MFAQLIYAALGFACGLAAMYYFQTQRMTQHASKDALETPAMPVTQPPYVPPVQRG